MRVTEKARMGLATQKKYQERTVPIPRWLTQQIEERRKSHPDDKLVFANINGTPDGHILRVLKRVSKRAGFIGRADDHKFPCYRRDSLVEGFQRRRRCNTYSPATRTFKPQCDIWR